jgi:hypothetical protein
VESLVAHVTASRERGQAQTMQNVSRSRSCTRRNDTLNTMHRAAMVLWVTGKSAGSARAAAKKRQAPEAATPVCDRVNKQLRLAPCNRKQKC